MRSFLALSDIHGSRRRLEKILEAAPSVDGVVLVGDITQLGGKREAEDILAPLVAWNPRIWGVQGNMDRAGVGEYLEERAYSIHQRGILWGGIGLFGVGGCNPTPFATPNEYSEQELAAFLRGGYAHITGATLKILVSHVPPAQTTLDRLGSGIHIGSSAVRAFLLEHDVSVCLCGHIHEAFGEEALGNTRCFNIGAVKDGRFALVEIDNGRITVTTKRLC